MSLLEKLNAVKIPRDAGHLTGLYNFKNNDCENA